MPGETSGVGRRVLSGRVSIAGEELPRVSDASHCLHYIHRRPDVWPRHEADPTRAQEQIEQSRT